MMCMTKYILSQLVKGGLLSGGCYSLPQGMDGHVKNKINDGLNTQRGDVSVLSDTPPK
jgi:hypothetical protein